jgi:hypothetical protein
MPRQNSAPAGDKKSDVEQNEKPKTPSTPVACSTPGKYCWVIFIYEIVTFLLKPLLSPLLFFINPVGYIQQLYTLEIQVHNLPLASPIHHLIELNLLTYFL